MTHQDQCPAIVDLTALLIEHGPAAMASALATLMNHAMQIERDQVLEDESHRRTGDRQGYAKGFKPKTLKTRVGLERLNQEIRRRTRVATILPNEASLLRLDSAVLSEISNDRETERA
jgi:hypothetical protein